jgi:Na+-transporting NADH:ubiquinone oxidoreductase subunit NqrB
MTIRKGETDMKRWMMLIVLVITFVLVNVFCYKIIYHKTLPTNKSETTISASSYYIRVEDNVTKHIEAMVSDLAVRKWKVASIVVIPDYTDAIVYDNKGDISHTVQQVLGWDVIIIAEKGCVKYESQSE